MERRIVLTADGSHSLRVDDLNEQYHSQFGAITESRHVFIKSGLSQLETLSLNILEVGFGTGLNALLSAIYSEENKGPRIFYTGIEKYPLSLEEWSLLNYADHLGREWTSLFHELHGCPWDSQVELTERFQLLKLKLDIKDWKADRKYDLVYFDAFAPEVQPELWNSDIFARIYENMYEGGLLLTYSVKGSIRRVLEETGFKAEKLEGPPGKRHILRATK